MSRSRIVALLRVILPLLALAILSTLFLLGRKPDPEAAIPYARIDAEDRARDPRMTRPEYAGVTADGAAITLSAERASPDPAQSGAAEALRLDWRAPGGLTVVLTAPGASMQGDAIRLTGGVGVDISTGWRIEAPEVVTDTEADLIEAPEGIRAAAPMGEIEAGAMRLQRAAEGQHVLNFTGGVRLLYQP